MARPKFIPTNAQLRKAWAMKKQKKQVKEIAAALKISPQQYSRARPMFNDFYIEQTKKERLNAIKKGIPEDILRTQPKKRGRKKNPNPLRGPEEWEESDFDYDMIRAYSVLGYSHETIAQLLFMSPACLYKYRKKYPLLDYTIKNGKKEISAKMVKNIQIQSTDRMVDDTAVASFQGNISTQKIQRHAPGSSQLIKLWMTNQENWASEPRPESKNNKGLILDMLSRLTDDDGGDGENT